jgi:hypothetical protein
MHSEVSLTKPPHNNSPWYEILVFIRQDMVSAQYKENPNVTDLKNVGPLNTAV